MATLSTQMAMLSYHEQRDPQWPDAADDIFDSFINPELFNSPAGEVERKFLDNDDFDFFDPALCLNGSDLLDTSASPGAGAHNWQGSGVCDYDENFSTEEFRRKLSIYSQDSRVTRSDTNLIVLPTDDVKDEHSYSITAPSTPRWRTKSRKPEDAPLSIRKRQSSASPSKIDKTRRATLRKMTPHHKASHTASTLSKRFQEADASGQLEAKIQPEQYRLTTPPPSAHMRSATFNDWKFEQDRAIRSPSAFRDDFESPISPLSPPTAFGRFAQHVGSRSGNASHGNYQLVSPSLERPSSERQAETKAQSLATYPSSPLQGPRQSLYGTATPPSMYQATWTPEHSFSYDVSPHMASADKTENWVYPSGPLDVTCGAPANVMKGFGLGIFGMNEQSHVQGAHGSGFGTIPSHRPATSGTRHPVSSSINRSTKSTSMPSMHPLSPRMTQTHLSLETYCLSTPQPQPSQFSPTPQQLQEASRTFRRHHQRSRTVGAGLTTIPPSLLTQPASAYASLHYPPMPSPTPAPTAPSCHPTTPNTRASRSRTATTGPSQTRSRSLHQRGKSASANLTPRQSAAAAGGFVNFTPSDSRKLLTGVAPSGSSKTKARRDKEAADRRRKLSEAARKAVLDAGGDPDALGGLEI